MARSYGVIGQKVSPITGLYLLTLAIDAGITWYGIQWGIGHEGNWFGLVTNRYPILTLAGALIWTGAVLRLDRLARREPAWPLLLLVMTAEHLWATWSWIRLL